MHRTRRSRRKFTRSKQTKKRKPTLSVEDQIMPEAHKRDNQIKVTEGRDAAKFKTRDTINKKNNLERENQRYAAAKDNY